MCRYCAKRLFPSLFLSVSLCVSFYSTRYGLVWCDAMRCEAMRCGSGFASKPFPRTLQATLSTAFPLPRTTTMATMLCSRCCITSNSFFFVFLFYTLYAFDIEKQRYYILSEILCQTTRKFFLQSEYIKYTIIIMYLLNNMGICTAAVKVQELNRFLNLL